MKKVLKDLSLSGSQINLQERPSPRVNHSGSRIKRPTSAVPAPGYQGPTQSKRYHERPQSADESFASRASDFPSGYSRSKSLITSQKFDSEFDLISNSPSPPSQSPQLQLKPGLLSKPPPIPTSSYSDHSLSPDLEEDIVDLKFRNWFPNSMKYTSNDVPIFIPDSRTSINDIPSTCQRNNKGHLQNKNLLKYNRYAVSDNYLNKINFRDKFNDCEERDDKLENEKNTSRENREEDCDTSEEGKSNYNEITDSTKINENFEQDSKVEHETNVSNENIDCKHNVRKINSNEITTLRNLDVTSDKNDDEKRCRYDYGIYSNVAVNNESNIHDHDDLYNEQVSSEHFSNSSNKNYSTNCKHKYFSLNNDEKYGLNENYNFMDNVETVVESVKNKQHLEEDEYRNDVRVRNLKSYRENNLTHQNHCHGSKPKENGKSNQHQNGTVRISKNANNKLEINKSTHANLKEQNDDSIYKEKYKINKSEDNHVEKVGARYKDFYIEYENSTYYIDNQGEHIDQYGYNSKKERFEDDIDEGKCFELSNDEWKQRKKEYSDQRRKIWDNKQYTSEEKRDIHANEIRNHTNNQRYINDFNENENSSYKLTSCSPAGITNERKHSDSFYNLREQNKDSQRRKNEEQSARNIDVDNHHRINNNENNILTNHERINGRNRFNENHYNKSMNILDKIYVHKRKENEIQGETVEDILEYSEWETEILSRKKSVQKEILTEEEGSCKTITRQPFENDTTSKSREGDVIYKNDRNQCFHTDQGNDIKPNEIFSEKCDVEDKNKCNKPEAISNNKEHIRSTDSNIQFLEMYDFEQDEKILNHILGKSKNNQKSILKNNNDVKVKIDQLSYDYNDDYPVKDLNSSTYNEIVDILKVLENEEKRGEIKNEETINGNEKEGVSNTAETKNPIINNSKELENFAKENTNVIMSNSEAWGKDAKYCNSKEINKKCSYEIGGQSVSKDHDKSGSKNGNPNRTVQTVQVGDIYSFLDKVNNHEINSNENDTLDLKPKTGGESKLADLMKLNSADLAQKYLTLSINMDEKNIIIGALEKRIEQIDKHCKDMKNDTDATVKRLQKFVAQLIKEKKELGDQCSHMCKDMEKKYKQIIETMEERHKIDIKRNTEKNLTAEKIRREKWIDSKTQKIKELTVKGLEPELLKMTNAHQEEISELRKAHNRQIEENDAIWNRKINAMKEKIEEDLQAAILAEKENGRKRLNDEMTAMENNYQQQRQHLLNEIQIERENLDKKAENIRNEKEKELNQKLEKITNQNKQTIEQLESKYENEIKKLKNELLQEKEIWIENKKSQMQEREQLIREQCKRERDKHIELIIQKLEKEQTERNNVAENKIKNMKENYDKDIEELETTMNTIKTKLSETRNSLQNSEDLVTELKAQVHSLQIENKNNKEVIDKYAYENNSLKMKYEQNTNDKIIRLEEEIIQTRQYFETLISRLKKDQENELCNVYTRVKDTIQKKEEVISLLTKQKQAALTQCSNLEVILAKKNQSMQR